MVVVCSKICGCGKICGIIEILSDWNNNLCGRPIGNKKLHCIGRDFSIGKFIEIYKCNQKRFHTLPRVSRTLDMCLVKA